MCRGRRDRVRRTGGPGVPSSVRQADSCRRLAKGTRIIRDPIRHVGSTVPTLEVRRHSVRDKPNAHLSPVGREIAREAGRAAGPFRRVISSPSARAVETAREMGFPDPERRASWESLGPEVDLAVAWPAPFSAYAAALRLNGAAAAKATNLLDEVSALIHAQPEDGAVLIITHGGFPEIVAVALLPFADYLAWGGPIRCMEGVRLSFEKGRATACQILRLPSTVGRL